MLEGFDWFDSPENNHALVWLCKKLNVCRLHVRFSNRVIGQSTHASVLWVNGAHFCSCIYDSSARAFNFQAIFAFVDLGCRNFFHGLFGENLAMVVDDHFIFNEFAGGDESPAKIREYCLGDSWPALGSGSFNEQGLILIVHVPCHSFKNYLLDSTVLPLRGTCNHSKNQEMNFFDVEV